MNSSPSEPGDDSKVKVERVNHSEKDPGAKQGSEDTGPESHDRTECDCGKDGHYEKTVCDEVVKASLGKVWNCVYGESKEFMMSFLRDNQRVQGISAS